MTVEERKGNMMRECKPRDQFPVGMRVLAVDDDPTCLKLLEALLLKCQYHVTTTSQAITALKMLRENKDKFDLVISDVHMPDMDGFKLLELVGLEMDLPVIMLSANSDTKAVMKGITHGACDYLLKPVRIEELKNIWQHVIRRRKFDARDYNNVDTAEDYEKNQLLNPEVGQGSITSAYSDRNVKINKKRKDQNEEDEENFGDNAQDNDEPSTQKKPRVVWSVELHRKFVAAVNQLGIEKAVPKRILDLMNVEGLTRENVASHLQKYRLYLKRLSAVASQQANLVAALRGGGEHTYLQMASLDGFRNYHAVAGPGQLPALTTFQTNGMLGRLNSPTGMGLHRLSPSGIVPFNTSFDNASLPINDLQKLQGNRLPTNQNANMLQGMPMPLEVDQKPNNPMTGGLPGCGIANANASSFSGVTDNALLVQGNDLHSQAGGFGNLASVRMPHANSNPFEMGLGDSTGIPDLTRCHSTWQAAGPSDRYSTSSSYMALPSNHDDSSSSNMANNVSPIISHSGSRPLDVTSSGVVAMPHDPLLGNAIQHQSRPLNGSIATGMVDDSKLLDFRGLGGSRPNWEEQKSNHHNSNLILNSSANFSLLEHTNDPFSVGQSMKNEPCERKMDLTTSATRNFGASYVTLQHKLNKDDYYMKTMKSQGRFGSSASDGLLDVMIKPDLADTGFMDGDIGCDIFSLGACM